MDANQWDERYANTDSVWGLEPNQFVRSQLLAAQLTPGKALDLGCGEGRNALWLTAQGWDALGVDFSRAAIDKATADAEHRGLPTRFEVGDVLTYELSPQSFDLVLIAYIQFEIETRVQLLERAVSALAPGGTFLLVAHDLTNLGQGYGGPQSSAVLWDLQHTVGLLSELEVEVAEVVERHVDTEDGPRTALDTLVRARRR